MIPMIDLKAQYAAIQDEVEAAVLDVLRSGWYVMGPHHDALRGGGGRVRRREARPRRGLRDGRGAPRAARRRSGVRATR